MLVGRSMPRRWSKRFHKHFYNANSVVGIIANWQKTGKILYLEVRNKYCLVCHKTAGAIMPLHTCFLNWDESSSAMETDIILKGFLRSEVQHGLRYTQFIGDGNSSVYPALICGIPYGRFIKNGVYQPFSEVLPHSFEEYSS